jgi:inorganic pyrophosphatase
VPRRVHEPEAGFRDPLGEAIHCFQGGRAALHHRTQRLLVNGSQTSGLVPRRGIVVNLRPEFGDLNVIIETPKGRRNKYKYNEETELFTLGGTLPRGAVFPFDFGFVPETLGEDGDPLDILVLMDEPAFPGVVVAARLIGVIEAEQTQEGQTNRNDRLIAVASESRDHEDVKTLKDLNPHLLEEIEHFFISYNEIKGKTFKPLGRYGPIKAKRRVEQGRTEYRKSKTE